MGKSEEIENWVSIEFQSQERHYIYPGFKAQGKKRKEKEKKNKKKKKKTRKIVQGGLVVRRWIRSRR